MRLFIITGLLTLILIPTAVYGPQNNQIFGVVAAIASVVTFGISAAYYGYEEHKKITNVNVLHRVTTEVHRVKMQEYDSEGALVATHEYTRDKRWIKGFDYVTTI